MNRKASDKTYSTPYGEHLRRPCMAFFNSAVGVLQTLVVALGAGLGIWGAINLLEGYGNDNPGAKGVSAQGHLEIEGTTPAD